MMAEIRPFRGLRYNPQRVDDLARVISPPYDVISPEQKKELFAKSPYNILHLDLPEGEDPYKNAKSLFGSWIQQQILIRDPQPSIYAYHQTFRSLDDQKKTRVGFLALIRLEEFDQGIVLPHESTLAGPKEDRLQLLRACQANFSPIFSLYSDPEQHIESLLHPWTSKPPDGSAEADGIMNTIWRISDETTIRKIQTIMQPLWILIADGHHRYESCLMYRNERQDPDPETPFQFTLMFFCNINHPGVIVRPYNRGVWNLPDFQEKTILEKASRFFELESFDSVETARATLHDTGKDRTAFLALFQNSSIYYLLKSRSDVDLEKFYPAGTPQAVRNLDVNILHKIFLQEVLEISEEEIRQQKYLKYYKDENEEWSDWKTGKLQIAFFLNPTRVDQVVEVSKAGKKMPQKSTFFYPKLMSGFAIHQFSR